MMITGISTTLHDRIRAASDELGLSFDTFVESALDAALERHDRRKLRGVPKEHRPKNPVGRPRLTAEERQFRDSVRDIESVYLSLLVDYSDQPGMFAKLFGEQYEIYHGLVGEKNFAAIQWWVRNAPWQKKNPEDFRKLWSTFASKEDTLTSNSNIGDSHEA